MKIGVSTYSLSRAIMAGELTVLDAIKWIADNGGAHVEITPGSFELDENPELTEAIRVQADQAGIDISSYTIGANFVQADERSLVAEIERVKKHVDIAYALGTKHMRHDVAWRPIPESTIANFYADLPNLTKACREVADYAAQFGITTSVENHGYHLQASDRVISLVQSVDRSNFRLLMDVGNFMCADENSVIAVQKTLPHASMIHIKDLYLRSFRHYPGDGWIRTAGGNYLRGAIIGMGDIEMWDVIRIIKSSGYDGYISVEFEGYEPCQYGTKTGMDNIRRIWDEV